MANRGLPKLQGGVRKRYRDAQMQIGIAPCGLPSCSKPSDALVQRWDGSYGFICEGHKQQARDLGYIVIENEDLS